MKPIDYAKAAGVACLLLFLNVLFSIPVIAFYAYFINPGHPREYYDKAALWIAPWCSHIIGTALFFVAGYFFTKRKPDRNGLWFAATFTGFYAFIDTAVAVAAVGFVGCFSIEHALSMLAKLLASLAGAFLATKNWKTPS